MAPCHGGKHEPQTPIDFDMRAEQAEPQTLFPKPETLNANPLPAPPLRLSCAKNCSMLQLSQALLRLHFGDALLVPFRDHCLSLLPVGVWGNKRTLTHAKLDIRHAKVVLREEPGHLKMEASWKSSPRIKRHGRKIEDAENWKAEVRHLVPEP